MRGLSSNVLAVAAMALSSLTTYLTFFDSSYTLTSAVASVSIYVQSGGGYSPEQGRSASYRYFAEPSVILSNRGTLAVVVSDIELVRSSDLEKCVATDEIRTMIASRDKAKAAPTVVEPQTVRQLTMEFNLKSVNAKADSETGEFDLPASKEMWCLRWTVFDPNGKRHEPMAPAFTLSSEYVKKPDENYPDAKLDKKFPKAPQTLIARGMF